MIVEKRLSTVAFIRVFVADGHPAARLGARHILAETCDLHWVGESANPHEAIDRLAGLRSDVLLLGMNLPLAASLEVATRLKERSSRVRILAWSAEEEQRVLLELLTRGVSGYLDKTECPERLVTAVREVGAGRIYFNGVRETARRSPRSDPDASGRVFELSRRERDVLRMMTDGHDNAGIAARLCLSTKTVKNHATAIYDKLGVRKRGEAVAWAWRNGMVSTSLPTLSGVEPGVSQLRDFRHRNSGLWSRLHESITQ